MKKGMTIVKEKLMDVSDLSTEIIRGMTEKQLKSYTDVLYVTAGTFPVQKKELENALQEMDYTQVFQWMKIISSSLSHIHADKFYSDCEKQINMYQDLDNIRHEKLKAYIDYFLSSLEIFFSDINFILEDLEIEDVEQKKDEFPPEKIKERLMTIPELNPERIRQMPDGQIYGYLEAVHAFLNDFPAQENGLRGSVKIRHYVFVLQWLASIEESLANIRADSLLEECRSQIAKSKDLNSIRHEKLEAFVNYFLSSLSMLSADIVMLHLPRTKPNVNKAPSTEKKVDEVIAFEVISPGARPTSKSILIVNKMKLFMNNFKVALGDTEYKIIGISSSDAALKYLENEKPDLFILDEDLPGKDGYALTVKIREMGQRSPIILTTSNITRDKMVKYMGAGIADFIIKPIIANDVHKKVSKHL
jgi:CheY-like chemotaxis protein